MNNKESLFNISKNYWSLDKFGHGNKCGTLTFFVLTFYDITGTFETFAMNQ